MAATGKMHLRGYSRLLRISLLLLLQCARVQTVESAATRRDSRKTGTTVAVGTIDDVPRRQARTLQLNRCRLDENGFYGDATTGSTFTVSYGYQVIVAEGVTLQMMRDDLVPQLDLQIAERLLPVLFDDDCDRRKLQTGENDPRITAISSRNPDVVIPNDVQGCIGAAADMPCWVVAGSLLVLGENFFSTAQVDDIVIPAIQLLMQGNALNFVNLLIDDVQFVDEGFQTVAPRPTPAPTFTRRPMTPRPSAAPTTRAPNLPPVTPGPTAAPVTPRPTLFRAPGSPTLRPATPSPLPPVVPTIGGTVTVPPATSPTVRSTPTAGTPTAGSGNQPGPTPLSTEPQGVDVVPWWGWLLVGIGGLLLLIGAYWFCCKSGDGGCSFFSIGGGGGGAVKDSSRDQGTDNDDDYMPPGVGGDDAYEPPGVGGSSAFSSPPEDAYEPPAVGSSTFQVTEAPDDEAGGYGYGDVDDGEDDDEEMTYEEEEEEGDSYEEGEGSYEEEEDYDDGDYDDEEGDSYEEEEESYYEEEEVGNNTGFDQNAWGTGF